jgi:N-methylhydantoinase B/oxoprolinase/acetone carboxylase alpha subunit
VTGNGQKGSGGSGTWTPGDAARDALRVLEVAAGVILIGLAAGIPLALVGGAAALVARSSRRRRRENALDAV